MIRLSTLTLEKLDALGTFQNEPRTVHVEHEGATLSCRLEAADALSGAFTQLRLAVAGRGAAVDTQQSAERICERLTYLLEPLQVVETDPDSGRVLLRSNPPHRDESTRTYYEVLVDSDGAITVQRFCRSREKGSAAAVPCRLTKEALARLIDDLVEISS